MILTGNEIVKKVSAGQIVIEPFDESCIEPNSYCFHLGDTLLMYPNDEIDSYYPDERKPQKLRIPAEGLVLLPNRFYLGCTAERIGSYEHATELYARLSTSLLGMFIQTSAPLGHTGAIIPWTLEIYTLQPIRVFAHMPIGKICFWEVYGKIISYEGRYKKSMTVVSSKLSEVNI